MGCSNFAPWRQLADENRKRTKSGTVPARTESRLTLVFCEALMLPVISFPAVKHRHTASGPDIRRHSVRIHIHVVIIIFVHDVCECDENDSNGGVRGRQVTTTPAQHVLSKSCSLFAKLGWATIRCVVAKTFEYACYYVPIDREFRIHLNKCSIIQV